MEKFVCVRIIQANGVDLAQFQFDFDLTFAAFFMNADGSVYGRYGTRSSRENATQDISLEGLRKALSGALALHAGYPGNKTFLAGKRGGAPRYKVPEEYPALRKYKPKLDYQGKGNLAKSCIHCHQVLDEERKIFRTAGKPIPDRVLYPWPMPVVAGLKLDPKGRAEVTEVSEGSPAAAAGFQPGDEILTLAGQAILSIADVQWVLHNAADQDRIAAYIRRGQQKGALTLKLDNRWRRKSPIAWRVSTWDLRRMASGGLVLEDLPAANRRKAQLAADKLALRIKHVGQYGAHAAAKRAGFKKGDVLVELSGKTGRMSETGLLAWAVQNKKPGQKVPVTVLRAGKRISLMLPMQ